MTSTPTVRSSSGSTMSIAAIIMTGSVMLSRVMGLVRELVLAGTVGRGTDMDAYVAAFLIPELLNHLMAGGFLSITFIPIFQKYITGGEKARAWDVFSNILTVTTTLLILFILTAMIFTGDFLSWAESLKGHSTAMRDPAWTAKTIRLTRIVLPAQVFFYIGSFLMAVQYAHRRFLLPALLPLTYNIVIILGGVVLGPRFGVEGFAWGAFAGALLGCIVLQIPGALRVGLTFRFRFSIRDADLRSYIIVTLPFIIGLGMTFSNEFFFRLFGLSLPEGEMAGLNFSLRTMLLLVGVFGQALAAASFPFLSQLAVEKRFDEMNRLSQRLFKNVAIALIPLSLIMSVLSRETIAVIFERGQFDAASTASTAPLLSIYALGAFGYSASMIVMRNFYAIRNTLYPMVVSTLTVIGSIPLYWFLSRHWGARGVALASIIYMNLLFVIFFILWNRRSPARTQPAMGPVMVKILLASIAAAATAHAIRSVMADLPAMSGYGLNFGAAVSLAVAGVASAATALMGMVVLRVVDIRDIVGWIKKKLPGLKGRSQA